MVRMGSVWDETAALFARRAGAVAAIALLGIALPTAISGIGNLHAAAATPGLRAALTVLGIATTVVTIWGQLALTALALGEGEGGTALSAGTATPTGVGGAFAVGARRLLPMLGAVLLVLLAFMALALPVIVLLAAAGVDPTTMTAPGGSGGGGGQMTPGIAIAVFAYALLMLPVALFLAARIVLVTPVVVAERRGLGALSRSWVLTRGLTWKLVGVLILYAIVALVAVAAAQNVFGALLLLVWGNGEPVNVATVVTAILVALVSSALSAMSTMFVALLYRAVMAQPAPSAGMPAEMPAPAERDGAA